ncbi:actin-binding Rho-activating protein-like [Neocloeon triangulifer]|uniref:actin-binding Rho-activating protein-like n=1 Tax=Neocloeon triangulifer TaxID=2078957 RepID=UPI00286F66CB|nr:actin-binding Rho-activating protein-like [Neocloeon triangulifer]
MTMAAASSSAQDDALKYLHAPSDMRHCRGVLSDKVAIFNGHAQTHLAGQARNPFSGHAADGKPVLDTKDANYGRPVEGSKTDQRGKKAMQHVAKEMLELCEIINEYGQMVPASDEIKFIRFGELFNIYTIISDKVVGLLLRARKHCFVDFEGEVLFQRRDDDVPVLLIKPIQEIRTIFKSGEALNHGTNSYAAVSKR